MGFNNYSNGVLSKSSYALNREDAHAFVIANHLFSSPSPILRGFGHLFDRGSFP